MVNDPAGESVDWLGVLKISGAFMAFLIGSGFATGQEAMQFFVAYGLQGVGGALVALLLFMYACASLYRAGRTHQLLRNEDVFTHFCGRYIGVFLTWYTMVFIVAVHAIMLAGAGATLKQAYGLPGPLGSGLMALASMATLLSGLNRIIDIISGIGPLIVVLTISIALLALAGHTPDIAPGARLVPELNLLTASPHWFFSGLLYVGMTLPGMASFLPALAATTGGRRDLAYASVIGPVLYICAMLLVVLALLANITVAYQAEVPIMALASDVLPLYGLFFAVVIFLGIYSTVTPLLWTVCERFAEQGSSRYRLLVVALTLLGYFGGTLLPFGELVNLIYPTVGYAGLLFLVCAIIKDIRSLKA